MTREAGPNRLPGEINGWLLLVGGGSERNARWLVLLRNDPDVHVFNDVRERVRRFDA